MNSSRTPNESALSEETDQPEKNILSEIKREVESFTSIKTEIQSIEFQSSGPVPENYFEFVSFFEGTKNFEKQKKLRLL